jgi:CheY-like chemotaxis protein
MSQHKLYKHASFLIVDDDDEGVRVLERILRGAEFYRIHTSTNPRGVAPLAREVWPDVILLSLDMPHTVANEVLDGLGPVFEDRPLPVLVLTTADTLDGDALGRGAKGFIRKPFRPEEVLAQVGMLLDTLFLDFEIRSRAQILEARDRERRREAEAAMFGTIERFARGAAERLGMLEAEIAGSARVDMIAAVIVEELEAQLELRTTTLGRAALDGLFVPSEGRLVERLRKLPAPKRAAIKSHPDVLACLARIRRSE